MVPEVAAAAHGDYKTAVAVAARTVMQSRGIVQIAKSRKRRAAQRADDEDLSEQRERRRAGVRSINYLAHTQSPVLGSGHSHPQPIVVCKKHITNISGAVICAVPLAGDQIARQKFPIAEMVCWQPPFLPSAPALRCTHIVGYCALFAGKLGTLLCASVRQGNLSDTRIDRLIAPYLLVSLPPRPHRT